MFSTEGHDVLSREAILKRISEFDIFRYYISGLEKPNQPFCSELRKDHSPTCRVSLLGVGYRYKDFGTGDTYTCFAYVQAKYGLKSYEALRVIAADFRLGLDNYTPVRRTRKPIIEVLTGVETVAKETLIKIVPKEFTKADINYWLQYNITPCLLKKYNVKSISNYYLNNSVINIPKAERAFAYCFGNYKYKILRPDNPDWKWTNNAGGIIQGLKQLPKGGDIMYITSSLKDVIVLDSLGFNSVAPQSENTLIDVKLIEKFKKYYNHVVIYYNNDKPGIEAAEEHSKYYNLPYIYHPEEDPKDPSDYVKEKGILKYKQLMEEMLWQIEIGRPVITSRD